MIGALLLMALSPMAEADAANAAYTQCLFAKSREAHAARLSAGAFATTLADACTSEQLALERISARLFAAGGEANAAARARHLAEDAKAMVVETYRKTLELEPQLRDLAALCKAHPEQCRE